MPVAKQAADVLLSCCAGPTGAQFRLATTKLEEKVMVRGLWILRSLKIFTVSSMSMVYDGDDDRFSIVLLSALSQTHCVFVACDSK